MSNPLLNTCLDALSRAGSDEAAWPIVRRYGRDLVADPKAGAELAAMVAGSSDGEDVPAELMLLEAVIEEARMDRENAGTWGAACLSTLDDAIARLGSEGDITEAGTYLLGRCYVRAGLEAPTALKRSRAAGGTESVAQGRPPQLDELLDRLRAEAEGDAYALHAALSEMLATVDAGPRTMLIGEIAGRRDPVFDRAGLYWLLDRASDTRRAAAEAWLRRARAGSIDAAITSCLIEMRNWLPADAARDTLDRAVKEALRREAGGGAQPKPWKLHRVLATIPDGAGAQSFAIAAQRDDRRGVAMLLLKQGFGVAEAYVVPCRSVTEQRQMLTQVAEETDALDVTPESLAPALAAALAEGHAKGTPPAHGLVDVAEICGLREVRPAAMSVEDWVAHLDPAGELSALSPQKFGRLVNASADWPDDYDLVQSWFENSAAVRQILTEAITPRSREAALWRHLETRRDWWARLIARTAAVLKAGAGGAEQDWAAFAATALALARGRPLRRVPIMSSIVVASLVAGEDPWAFVAGDDDDAGQGFPEETGMPVDFSLPAPEEAGELKRVLEAAAMEITPDWVDGYIAAVVVAPKFAAPSAWVGGLLDRRHGFAHQDALQRFLDIVVMRYNAASTVLADLSSTRARVGAYDADGLRQWAQGFTESVACNKGAWGGKTMAKDDKKILKLIASTADGRAGRSELGTLLPAWLARRRGLAR
jgi:hypothetical protein